MVTKARKISIQLTFECDGGDGVGLHGMRARIASGTNQTVGDSFDTRERELFDPLRVFAALV